LFSKTLNLRSSPRKEDQVPVHKIQEIKSCRIWGSHSGGYENFYLLGYNTVQSIESQPTFRMNTSPSSSELKNKPSKIPAWRQVARNLCFQRTQKIEPSR
jgi:hypothetical protein